MTLLEMIKKPFIKRADSLDKQLKTNSSTPSPENTDSYLSTGGEDVVLGFFDRQTNVVSYDSILGSLKKSSLDSALEEQKQWIETYRMISEIPEVSAAISEIVDEATFAEGKEDTIILEFDAEVSDKLKEKIKDEFKEILKKLNISKNLYFMFERFYIDGQLNLHVSYSKRAKDAQGIRSIRILSPYNLYYSFSDQKWLYKQVSQSSLGLTSVDYYGDNQENLSIQKFDSSFSPEEVVHIDSGIYKDNIILSDLHSAVKAANNLQTLEEMLIPMRWSRSSSRRVFNLDVGEMSAASAKEYLKEVQERFKYNKFYDVKTGTISNQQHITALSEDYWILQRNGSKGVTVETLDETGNLGETGDLDYFKAKLYTALRVPTSRMTPSETGGEFDFTATTVTREELKFFNFITRKRNQFAELFISLLKRQLIQTKVLTEPEFDALKENMSIVWQSSNKFFERMRDEQLTNAITMYRDFEELALKGWISKKFLYQEVLKFNEDEILEIQDQIRKEKEDDLYRRIQVGDEPIPDLDDPSSDNNLGDTSMDNTDYEDDTGMDSYDDSSEEPTSSDEPEEVDYGTEEPVDTDREVSDTEVDDFIKNYK